MELTLAAPVEIRLPERLDRAALAQLRSDVLRLASTRAPVAVVRGAGPESFCRGISFQHVGRVGEAERDAGLADFEEAALALVTSATRTVARVHGDALGGGLGVAAACDVVVASEGSRFGLPEPLFGLIPGLVLPLIRSRTGGPVLRRLALSGDSVDAREAWRLGLVDDVVAGEALDARVAVWVRRLARAEPGAAGRLKRWLADMDGLAGEMARGRAHLAELLGSTEVTRRVERYQRGLAPWEDDGGIA
jgi:enoyl-CoA hydratase/carnithine racemase